VSSERSSVVLCIVSLVALSTVTACGEISPMVAPKCEIGEYAVCAREAISGHARWCIAWKLCEASPK
jgi:hypothetical protein